MMPDKNHRIPIVYSPHYEMDLGNHVFPVNKYRRIIERLKSEPAFEHRFRIVEPEPVDRADLLLVHSPTYVDKVEQGRLSQAEIMIMEIPWSPSIVQAMKIVCGGTVLATRIACQRGLGIHVGGGFHHAFPDHGEGFCMFHDVAVAIRKGQHEKAFRRALIIDLDVHHGNGSAYIFRKDPNVFTFSIHQENNYPAVKPPGDLDIGLPDGADDNMYLEQLASALESIRSRFQPDIVYYLAGADPYRFDQLGGLNLSIEGFARRDRMVFTWTQQIQCPLVLTLAGGYAVNPEDTVTIHLQTIRIAVQCFESNPLHNPAPNTPSPDNPPDPRSR